MPWIVLDLAKLESCSAHRHFLLKNWVHTVTKNERKGQDESSKGFFEDHCSLYSSWRQEVLWIQSLKRSGFYTFSVTVFVPQMSDSQLYEFRITLSNLLIQNWDFCIYFTQTYGISKIPTCLIWTRFFYIHIGFLTCLLTDTVSCLSFGKLVPVYSSKAEVSVYLQPGQWYNNNLPKIVPTCLIMDMKF